MSICVKINIVIASTILAIAIPTYTGKATLAIFTLSYAVLSFGGSFCVFLQKHKNIREFTLASVLALGSCSLFYGIAWLVYKWGGHLATLTGAKGSEPKTGISWLSDIDYLSAGATIISALIAACISLIPILWLIRQIKLQKAQNNTDMFARACQMAEKGLKSYKPKKHDEALILLRASIPLLREAIIQDKTYSWAGARTLITIYETLYSRRKITKKGVTLRVNILRAFGEVAERISNKDDAYDPNAVDEMKGFIEEFKESPLSVFSKEATRILNILNKNFSEN